MTDILVLTDFTLGTLLFGAIWPVSGARIINWYSRGC